MQIHEQPTQFYPPLPPASEPSPTSNAADEVWVRVPVQPKRPFFRPLLEGLIVSLFFLAGLLTVGGGWWLFNSDLILPGVRVLGQDVSGLTASEAEARLNQMWQQEAIVLTLGSESWTVHPSELGVTFDAAATVQTAVAKGRTVASWQQFFDQNGRFTVQPTWEINMQVAEAALTDLASQRNVPPTNARVQISQGRVSVIPAVDGLALDVPATLAQLSVEGAMVVQNGRLPLITQPIPATVTDVSQMAAEAERLLQTSVTVRAYDPITDDTFAWVIGPEVWGNWLTMDVDSTQPSQFTWTLDEAGAEAFFAERMAALGNGRFVDQSDVVTAVSQAIQTQQTDAVRLRIYYPDRLHVVQAGETLSSIGVDYGIPYPWIQAVNPALSEGLTPGQAITIPSPDVMLPLAVVENKRIVVSISQQRVWVYENGQLKWDWLASTGIDSSPTAPGIFQIQSREENAYAGNWDLWMPNFMGVYQPVPNVPFMNGFHGFPTRDGSNLLWTQNLGRQVTYGCILLSNENSKLLYDWAEDGVVVEIRP